MDPINIEVELREIETNSCSTLLTFKAYREWVEYY